ncbi:hypothetical protein KIN20_036192 [Parelaphostrongylus tenuis]|uniref:Uncharacterized protein n=1 Tax=Parelaphostrongylus tenuis TaxID=148309 RepID=A0AAD5RCM6_PARTN|nr:hypothetical protein KIN20_036192 [Parelaphostrongylus tenuis]
MGGWHIGCSYRYSLCREEIEGRTPSASPSTSEKTKDTFTGKSESLEILSKSSGMGTSGERSRSTASTAIPSKTEPKAAPKTPERSKKSPSSLVSPVVALKTASTTTSKSPAKVSSARAQIVPSPKPEGKSIPKPAKPTNLKRTSGRKKPKRDSSKRKGKL